jgi:type III pantothenate kinase
MNLAIDIGNSMTKMAVLKDYQIVDTFRVESPDDTFFEQLFKKYPKIDSVIAVSTRADGDACIEGVKKRVNRYFWFDNNIKIPIKNLYQTPATLGHDRIAGAVAAAAVYPNSNILIVDFGTAITVDFVSADGEFVGGVISPGLKMRLRALNEFTQVLPLCNVPEQTYLTPQSTETAITSGVVNGIVFEIQGYIDRYMEKYPELRIVFTGGDGGYFSQRFKNPMMATRDLVVYGLNRILEYNVQITENNTDL